MKTSLKSLFISSKFLKRAFFLSLLALFSACSAYTIPNRPGPYVSKEEQQKQKQTAQVKNDNDSVSAQSDEGLFEWMQETRDRRTRF